MKAIETSEIEGESLQAGSSVRIINPANAAHFMDVEPSAAAVRASAAGAQVAETDDVLIVRETYVESQFEPVAYFSRAALPEATLRRSDTSTRCPLKGVASYYDVFAAGEWLADAAWSYEEMYTFDPRLELLRDRLAFDLERVDVARES